MAHIANIPLPNGRVAVCFTTSASVSFLDAGQLADIIDFLSEEQYIGQKVENITIVKQLDSLSHAGEAVIIFAPPPAPILPSYE